MRTPLRLLHVEDSPDDAELLLLQLDRDGFDLTTTRVDTPATFAAALDGASWDVVVSDHALPGFDAPEALALLKERSVDLPFVVFSGTMSTAAAIALMKAGAHDFVSKDDPARLELVIRRELREAENRWARAKAERDRAQMVVELEAANRAKDEFLAMLGHELRNPLAPIVTALQLIRLRRDSTPSRELAVIERQVHHLMGLVDDLFDVAKIARGKVELRRQIMELALVVAKAIEIASPLLEQRMHHLTVDVPRGLWVDADEGRLAQVVSNLLTNAARYTPPSGAVSLTAAREDAEIVLRVKDSGIGIESELLPALFEPFIQGKRGIERSEGGLGLGLALVRNLVTLHSGTVAAYSDGKDRGSEFVVRLPAAAAPAAAAEPPAAEPPLARDAPTGRVLVVDDNEDAAFLLAELIGSSGYEVEIAHDGPDALALLDRFVPTAIILDIGLPVMDGFELARQIRLRPEHRATKLVAVSGYGQPDDRARSQQAGFDLHLVKPVDGARLLQILDASTAAARAR